MTYEFASQLKQYTFMVETGSNHTYAYELSNEQETTENNCIYCYHQ